MNEKSIPEAIDNVTSAIDCAFNSAAEMNRNRDGSNANVVDGLFAISRSISALAVATESLLYGLKYNKQEGMSIAEAIEEGSKNIAKVMKKEVG